jgi:hypothetical protein
MTGEPYSFVVDRLSKNHEKRETMDEKRTYPRVLREKNNYD